MVTPQTLVYFDSLSDFSAVQEYFLLFSPLRKGKPSEQAYKLVISMLPVAFSRSDPGEKATKLPALQKGQRIAIFDTIENTLCLLWLGQIC